MKTLLTTIATLAVAMLFYLASTPAAAQNPDLCKPDCDSSELDMTRTITLVLPSGCVVRVDYANRKARGMCDDVGIVKIEVIGNCGYISGPKDILDRVTDALLAQNPMNFPLPDTNEYVNSWRVDKGA